MILAIVALAVLVGLSMHQADRLWDRTVALESRLESIDERLTRLRVGDAGGGVEPSSVERWWREGVTITRPERLASVGTLAERTGGELVRILEGSPRTITPYVFTDSFALRVLEGNVTESLGGFDPGTTELRGVLASAWQMDPEGLWLRVKIDERARFSDGEPVTSADVAYTFEEIMMNPLVDAPRFRDTFGGIAGVRAVTGKAVEFTFDEPMFNNLTLVLRFPILPEHVYERYTPEQINRSTGLAVGSGPYRLEGASPDDQWTPGVGNDVVLVRNEAYWSGRPGFDSMRFRVVTGASARLTSFRDGEAHLMRPSPEQFEAVSADESFDGQALSWRTYPSGYTYIMWMCGRKGGDGALTPFADARVRRAMTMLLDRGRILRDFYRGNGGVSTGPFSPVTPQSDPSIVPTPFDMEGARALLDEAGWIDRDGDGVREDPEGRPFVFEFTYPRGSSTSPKIARYLKDQCARVGIVMEERVLDFSVFLEARRTGDFDAMTLAQGIGFPESDPYQQWHSDSIDGGANFARWSSERADALIEHGRRTLDREARMAIWHELHGVIQEEQPCTFLIDRAQLRLVSDAVRGVRASATGLDLRAASLVPSGGE